MTSRLQLFLKSILAQRFGVDSLTIDADKFILKIKDKKIDLLKSQIQDIKEMSNYLTLGKSFESSDTVQISHQNSELSNPLFFVSRSNELVANLKQRGMVTK
jgi:hypothetical protein